MNKSWKEKVLNLGIKLKIKYFEKKHVELRGLN